MLTYSTEVIDLYPPRSERTHWYVKATVYQGDRAIATAHIIPWGEFMPDMIKQAENEAIKRAYELAHKYVLNQGILEGSG